MLLTKIFTLLVPLVSAGRYTGYECKDDVKAIVPLWSPNNTVTGTITFTQAAKSNEVHITGEIAGLSDGKHGFHVHAFGDIVTDGCMSTGGHYNPFNVSHGAPDDKKRHIGDLGNIESSGGKATVDITDNVVSLCGRRTVLGRGIVVHVGEDDLGRGNKPDSKTTGAAGARAACGVISVADPTK